MGSRGESKPIIKDRRQFVHGILIYKTVEKNEYCVVHGELFEVLFFLRTFVQGLFFYMVVLDFGMMFLYWNYPDQPHQRPLTSKQDT